LRTTKKRQKIIDLFKSNQVLNADDIIRMLPGVDPATIYRGLKVLTAEKIIRAVSIEKTRANYELNSGRHQYFKCTGCGSLTKIYDFRDEIAGEVNKIGAQLDSYEVIAKGLCKECLAEESFWS
jgi:Fe2+ or Zn2+ uptake regulation protein